ncbi:signal peptidase II [Longimicrobium sp.]|uniref:signal peptidase II n=1 Tax=Longimicrobium sp. TaxID=2029185 RepID=UPI002C782976|nr:signal peptidase II [Longimicrobium sp.]HSU17930.1 signal peptidase II [Longimicrobium sp.]
MTENVMTQSQPMAATTPADEARRKMVLYAATVGGVIVLDQVTKAMVLRTLRPYTPVEVGGDFFRLTFIYNTGAAFGLHLGDASRWVFMALAAVAVVVLWVMFRGTPWRDRLRLIAIASVTGGAIGNVIDRVRSARGVVDFLDFGVGETRWPVFNVADIAVTCGALLLAYSLWREEQKIETELDIAEPAD